jgi:hypothetical protein
MLIFLIKNDKYVFEIPLTNCRQRGAMSFCLLVRWFYTFILVNSSLDGSTRTLPKILDYTKWNSKDKHLCLFILLKMTNMFLKFY